MSAFALIGLGSNLGDRQEHLDAAVAAIRTAADVNVRAVSRYRDTRPAGGPAGQPGFLNAALSVDTVLPPHDLLSLLHDIENARGRERHVRWGERTLDLDLLTYGEVFLDSSALKLPHPRLALRRFVVEPLAEIAPEAVDVTSGRTIAWLLSNLDRRPSYVAIAGENGPLRDRIFQDVVRNLAAFAIAEEEPISAVEHSGRLGCITKLERHARLLERELSRAGDVGEGWLVSEFSVSVERRLLTSALSSPAPALAEESFRDVPAVDGQLWDVANVPEPTFVVMLPGSSQVPRRPGFLDLPVLWPESNEAGAIRAEILAACSATRPG